MTTPRRQVDLSGVTALRVLVDDSTDIALDFADGRATVLIAAPYDRRGQRALVAALEAATGVPANWSHPLTPQK